MERRRVHDGSRKTLRVSRDAHLIGTRVGIAVARTIRRLPTSEHEESRLVVPECAHLLPVFQLKQQLATH